MTTQADKKLNPAEKVVEAARKVESTARAAAQAAKFAADTAAEVTKVAEHAALAWHNHVRHVDRDAALDCKAREQGAQKQWVSPSGFTELPTAMVEELGLTDGGYLWFIKANDRWEAWLEPELDKLFGLTG